MGEGFQLAAFFFGEGNLISSLEEEEELEQVMTPN